MFRRRDSLVTSGSCAPLLYPKEMVRLRYMTTNVTEKKLRSLIKESMREVLENEVMKLRALALPEVSDREQRDIERRYGRPSRKSAGNYSL